MVEERTVEPEGFRLWFGTFGAAGAWFVHLVVVYVLVPVTCALSGPILMYVASALLIGVAVAAGLVAWSSWRQLSEEARGNLIGEMEGSRKGFMLYAGLLASGVFLLAILMATIPIFFLNPCTMEGRI
ncbi:MAG: hypothetical protein ACLFU8_15360 [Anaerolineales bacterium]